MVMRRRRKRRFRSMCLGRAVAHIVESGPIYTEGTTANSYGCQPMSAPRARLAAQYFGHPQIQGIHSHPPSPVTLIETVSLFGVILRGTESTKQKGKEATEQLGPDEIRQRGDPGSTIKGFQCICRRKCEPALQGISVVKGLKLLASGSYDHKLIFGFRDPPIAVSDKRHVSTAGGSSSRNGSLGGHQYIGMSRTQLCVGL